MVSKKILVILAVVLILGVIGFFIFGTKIGTSEGTTITSLHLESFPAGTQMGPGLVGTETTKIKKGEIVVISGTATTNGVVDSKIKIFGSDSNFLLEQSCVQLKGSGGFGCGLNYPQIGGIYTLKFYINDIEKMSIEFEVTE